MAKQYHLTTIPSFGVNLIEANAGTGKTHAITDLFIRFLLEKRLVANQLLVVTFTVAATEELRARVRSRISQFKDSLLTDNSSDELYQWFISQQTLDKEACLILLEHAKQMIDELSIYTIHGFCQRMLVEYSLETGVVLQNEILPDEQPLLLEIIEDYWRENFYELNQTEATLLNYWWSSPSNLLQEISPCLLPFEFELRSSFSEKKIKEIQVKLERLFSLLLKKWQNQKSEIIACIIDNEALSKRRDAYHQDNVQVAFNFLNDWFDQDKFLPVLQQQCELFSTDVMMANALSSKLKKGLSLPIHDFFDEFTELWRLNHGYLSLKKQQLQLMAITHVQRELVKRKSKQGLIAFDDLLRLLADALQGNSGQALARRIRTKFPVAMVDEFQDTDPLQYDIFKRIYNQNNDSSLIMIGDPKQAIYRFRGADIFTYLVAKDNCPIEHQYTLTTNWRSSSQLITAVNTLFQSHNNPFVYQKHIDFKSSIAAGLADETPLSIHNENDAFILWTLPENQLAKNNVNIKQFIANTCASEIIRLIELSQQGKANIGDKPLKLADIAILVRDRYEAEVMIAALNTYQLSATFLSHENIFKTAEAHELAMLLKAIADPTIRHVKNALCSNLFQSYASNFLPDASDEEAWQTFQNHCYRYRDLWQQQGVLAMLFQAFVEYNIIHRLLKNENGQRQVSNLMQLAEQLQHASDKTDGLTGLLRWFANKRYARYASDVEEELRLESDSNLIQIVTIHKSKGLQYPIVFTPFLWSNAYFSKCDNHGILRFHDSVSKQLVIDLTNNEKNNQAYAEKEQLAEAMRLIYVAFTRAQYRCYCPVIANKAFQHSALNYLLSNSASNQINDHEQLHERLKKIGSLSNQSITVREMELVKTANLSTKIDKNASALSAKSFYGNFAQTIAMTSYTKLTTQLASSHASELNVVLDVKEQEEHKLLPRGAVFGQLVHQLLENMDFSSITHQELLIQIERSLVNFGFGIEYANLLQQLINNALDAKLYPLDLTLRNINHDYKIVEMEFCFPWHTLNLLAMDELIFSSYPLLATQAKRLQEEKLQGYMKGFIDLIFVQNNKFYIADYKTNYLGEETENYKPDNLISAIAEHRYDLQYLIYSVALDKYLSKRLKNYDYTKHFGGIYYLFLRGLEPNSNSTNGIYYDLPPYELITKLDKLINHG